MLLFVQKLKLFQPFELTTPLLSSTIMTTLHW